MSRTTPPPAEPRRRRRGRRALTQVLVVVAIAATGLVADALRSRGAAPATTTFAGWARDHGLAALVGSGS